MALIAAALGAAIACDCSVALGQAVPAPPSREVAGEDHSIVFELGAAADWSRGEPVHPGGTFAFEITPVENWLELEFGWTAIHNDKNVEMPLDVLFKKPWQISPAFEFMLGAGPEWIHTAGPGPEHGNAWGANAVLDFMFWPRRNVGWYAEPGYEAVFRDGTHHGLGLAVGVLIGR
jgi:hypothetical protein